MTDQPYNPTPVHEDATETTSEPSKPAQQPGESDAEYARRLNDADPTTPPSSTPGQPDVLGLP